MSYYTSYLPPEKISDKDTITSGQFGRIGLKPDSKYVLFGHFGFQPTDGNNYKVYLTRQIPSLTGDSLELYFFNADAVDVEIEVFTWQTPISQRM